MASGLPVVAVSSVGYRDTIRHGREGILCKEDISDFSNAVLYLLEDAQKREDMGDAALNRAREYSSKNVIGKIVDLYQCLLKN